MTDTSNLYPVGPTAGMYDAKAVIGQLLQQYGLQSMADWAWNEIVNGASADQVAVDMYDQKAFQDRFPGIFQRQTKGLPPISPADYVNYENQAKQIENRYALPQGFLTDPNRIANLIGNDVSTQELEQDRIANGYAHVANAPAEVRQAFSTMFGAYGDGALAAHFLDIGTAAPLLQRQATAADIAGHGALLGINPSADDAMRLASMGETASSTQSGFQKIAQESGLYNQAAGDTQQLDAGKQGVEAEFGLSELSTEQVQQQREQRAAEFAGGGGAEISQQGTSVGAAKPF